MSVSCIIKATSTNQQAGGWVQSETYTDAHADHGGAWEKWSFICVPGNHICGGQCSCLHHDNSVSAHHPALLQLSPLSFIMTLCCGGVVDRGQLKQLPLSSQPPPTHLLSSNLTFRNWMQARFTKCKLWFWQMAKRGYVGGRRRRKGTNWTEGKKGERRAEEGGTMLTSELLPDYCKRRGSACSCPCNLSHCSLPFHICPHSSSVADLITETEALS